MSEGATSRCFADLWCGHGLPVKDVVPVPSAGSGGVQEDALMAVSTLVEGQWATVRQGNFCRMQESFSSHEEFLTAKSIVLSFHIRVIESVQSWSEHEYKFVRNCLAFTPEVNGSQCASQAGSCLGVEGTHLPHVPRVPFPLKRNFASLSFDTCAMEEAKVLCFLSWHLVPSGLGFNALDLGWDNMVLSMWNGMKTLSSRN